ncbi:MAG: EI24 domain-containing protein [Saprospiraceae bacterium]|nr:EI24 domain-containing protein [Saprospiraceae bacterium]
MITGYFKGVTTYFDGLKIISRYGLWSYLLAPALIGLLLGGGILSFAWRISGSIGDWMIGFYPLEWGKGTLESIANVFGGILVIAVGLIIFKQLVLALSSPFMSFMSETIERRMKADYTPVPFSAQKAIQDLLRGLTIALRNIIRELFYTFLLFLLGLIPIFTPFTTIAIFLVQSFYAGFGSMDYTLERRYNVRQSVTFVRNNRSFALGNGTIFMALLLTGVGFLLALPLGTAAATGETLKRLNEL